MPREKLRANKKTEKILWVENDLGHIQDYVDALVDQGSVVLKAATISDAVNTIQAHKDISTVILDVMLTISSEEQRQFSLDMSGGSKAGLALGRWIRENRPEIKLFGFTYKIDKDIAIWFKRYGIGFALKQSISNVNDFVHYFRRAQMEKRQFGYLKAFIVHGKDEKEKLALKNYLQNTLGLPEPIILHEQPSLGQTIIEKFERVSEDIDIVFVLLTPDDMVVAPGDSKSQLLRARQNVIFELGYFIGKIERKNGRVIILYKGKLEMPSDLSGVIYINIDNGIESAGEQIRRELQSI